MKIETISFNGKEYKVFKDVKVFSGTDKENVILFAPEERLEKDILELIEHDRYTNEVKEMDERYGYYLPQEVADAADESEVTRSLEDAIDDDVYNILGVYNHN